MKLKSRIEFLNESSFDDLFGVVHQGDYDCYKKDLKSLVDLDIPDTVTGDFNCNSNHLTSLEGAPTSIGGYFFCSLNVLTTLEGAPTSIGGDFSCSSNMLTSLKGHPKEVKGDFYISDCPLITDEMIENLKKNCKIGGKIIR